MDPNGESKIIVPLLHMRTSCGLELSPTDLFLNFFLLNLFNRLGTDIFYSKKYSKLLFEFFFLLLFLSLIFSPKSVRSKILRSVMHANIFCFFFLLFLFLWTNGIFFDIFRYLKLINFIKFY